MRARAGAQAGQPALLSTVGACQAKQWADSILTCMCRMCAGGFIDDYRLDEGYRNDLGFLYCCHVSEGRPAWLELVPTQIVHTRQVCMSAKRGMLACSGGQAVLYSSCTACLRARVCRLCGWGPSAPTPNMPVSAAGQPGCVAALRIRGAPGQGRRSPLAEQPAEGVVCPVGHQHQSQRWRCTAVHSTAGEDRHAGVGSSREYCIAGSVICGGLGRGAGEGQQQQQQRRRRPRQGGQMLLASF